MPAPLEEDPDDAEAQPVGERCSTLELDNGELVIYDVEVSSAWVQSNLAVDLVASL